MLLWNERKSVSRTDSTAWARQLPIAIGVLLLLALPAHATLIRVDFTGVVAAVGGDLAGGPIAASDAVAGHFVYDTNTPNVGGGNVGMYASVSEHALTVGVYSITLDGTASLRIGNDQPSIPSPFDSITVNSTSVLGSDINGLSPSRFQFGLESKVLTKVLSTDVPGIAELLRFDVADGKTNFNFLAFGSGSATVRWNLTSFTPTVVPEPTTGALLAVGLVTLGWKRRNV